MFCKHCFKILFDPVLLIQNIVPEIHSYECTIGYMNEPQEQCSESIKLNWNKIEKNIWKHPIFFQNIVQRKNNVLNFLNSKGI